MAINKTINKSTKSHGAMRNCIEYVTRVDKTRGELVEIIGPYEPDSITYDRVYQSFLEEKRIWGKDSGRMYAHNIISWHEDEPITPEQALKFGKEFAEQWFDGFQSLVGVHIDRNRVHCHIVTNSVSYMDGHKLHNSRKDLQCMKDFTNQMCRERGLSVAQKGRDFHGNELEQGTVSAWSKDKYHLMQNEARDSFVADCGIACLDALEVSCSREEFVEHMAERGWSVTWKDSRKHITFQNAEGKKVRDSNLSKTFHLNISKEALENEFERQAAAREETARYERELADRREQESAELERYYREVRDAAEGAVRDDSYTKRYHQRTGEDNHQQTADICEQDRKIAELKNSLKQSRTDMSKMENNLIEQHESKLSEKDSQILQAQNLAQEWKKKAGKAEQGLKRMEQSYSSQISMLKSEIQNLSDRIVKLNGADLVLKENEKLIMQNEKLQKSEREAKEEAEKEIAHVKSEYHRKEQELDRLVKETEQEKQKALSLQSVVQKLTDQKAKRLTENTRRQWQIWYQTKKASMQGYMGVLTVICFVTTVLSVIRQRVFCEDVIVFFKNFWGAIQVFAIRMNSVILSVAEVTEKVSNNAVAVILKWVIVILLWAIPAVLIGFGTYKFWEKYGEDIRKGIDVWNCSVAMLALVGLVYFGDYVKEIIAVNLFGIWLLVDVLLVLAGWYVWGCKKHRGLC